MSNRAKMRLTYLQPQFNCNQCVPLKNALLLLIITAMSGTLAYDSTQYSRDAVLKLHPKTNESEAILSKYIDDNDVDVWSDVYKPTHACIVRLKENRLPGFEYFLKNNSIEYKYLTRNLKIVLDKQLNDTLKYKTDRFNYSNYNRFDDIEEELYHLEYDYYHRLVVDCVGFSYEGYPLYIVKMTSDICDEKARKKPIIWVDGGIHAREWISIAVTMNLIRELLEGYGKNATITDLLDRYMLYIIPVFNPDGYEYSWQVDRLWRKTRSFIKNSTCRGVDANRNFDYNWATVGSSNDPCSLVYHGPKAASEPCVRIFSRCLKRIRRKLIAYFNLHSFFQLFLYPYSFTRTFAKSFPANFRLGNIFSTAARRRFNTDYLAAPASILIQPTGGNAIDYVHDVIKVEHSYAIELRDRGQFGFLLPADQILPNSQEFFDGFMALMQAIETDLKNKNKTKQKNSKTTKNRKT